MAGLSHFGFWVNAIHYLNMKLRNKTAMSFIAKFLLALMLVQFHFPSQIFCIEEDGSTSIEIAPLGNCSTTLQEKTSSIEIVQTSQNCNQAHPDSVTCNNCTDIPLKQEISMSRSDSEQATLNVLSPLYFNLYAGEFKPYIAYPKQTIEPFSPLNTEFVYHPHQTLESIILLI